jgi:uncharacterized protein YjbI with pentapeptide repeats
VNLTDTNLKYANLTNADLTDANLKYARICKTTMPSGEEGNNNC